MRQGVLGTMASAQGKQGLAHHITHALCGAQADRVCIYKQWAPKVGSCWTCSTTVVRLAFKFEQHLRVGSGQQQQ